MKFSGSPQALLSRHGLAALMAVLLSAATLQAQTPPPKKPAPAPAKPAAKPAAPAARPAVGGAATHSAASTTATHGATTTTTSHSVTTTSPHGATTTSTTTHTTTTAPAARGGFGGGPAGRTATGPAAHTTAMGRPAPVGSRAMHGPGGDVRMRPGGRPMDVHDTRRGMDIHHNLGGGRRVFIDRPGGGHMYYERGRPGYIGHPYMAHGYEFNRRTYYYNGRAYDRFYRPYPYHGFALEVYAPVRYYPVGFYGWAYHPWITPVPYAWGYAGSPWYGYYGAYYTPYPVYSAPSLWLTDYMISQTLMASYAAQQAAGTPPGPAYAGPGLSPDVKQMVADEVQRQIALENAEAAQNAAQQAPDPASSGVARLFSDGQPHVFVAGREVDVVDANGAECAITDGDVIQMTTPPGPQDTAANVVVLSSKGGQDCRRTAMVAVPIDELQDMNNHMRETVDQGMQELQAKQGQGGLPPAPASAMAAPATSFIAQDAPPPDPNGAKELEQQAQQSEVAEKDVLAQATTPDAGAPGDAAPAPVATADVSIAPGQSTDDVKGALGAPTRIVSLGPKTMYFYKDMKVTFVNGKVTNIE